jgi:hypothetical protein
MSLYERSPDVPLHVSFRLSPADVIHFETSALKLAAFGFFMTWPYRPSSLRFVENAHKKVVTSDVCEQSE